MWSRKIRFAALAGNGYRLHSSLRWLDVASGGYAFGMSNVGSVSQPALQRAVFLPDSALGKIFSSPFRKALFIFGVWTVIGLLLFVPDAIAGMTISGLRLTDLVNKVVDAWAWAFLTPAILYVDRKLSRFDSRPLMHVGVFLLFSVPFSLVHLGLTGVMLYPYALIWWNPLRYHGFIPYYFLGGWQVCCAIIGTLEAFRYYRRYVAEQTKVERAERRLLESHLNTLRMQLEPHFLFNALNAISSEVINNPGLARDMIEDLGSLLRLSLDYQDNQEIPLSQELTLLEHYLAIQRVRFGDRIQTEVHVDPDVLKTRVPSMLLQPIVENAIRHGLGNSMSGGTVTVSATRSGDCLELRVIDDGRGLPHNWQTETARGLGLRVTRERLEGLYPDVANPFEIRPGPVRGTEVIMRVPMRGSETDDHGPE